MKACPNGWHLPDNTEWNALLDVVGEKTVVNLKATSGWNYDNGEDKYGFSALPGGVGYSAYWWSSSEYDSGSVYFLDMGYYEVLLRNIYKDYLLPVRCVQD